MKKGFIASIMVSIIAVAFCCAPAAQATEETAFSKSLGKASAGDAEAQFYAGVSYLTGSDGNAKDSVKAREWFEKAAAQSHTQAMAQLAKLYENGEGVEQDYKKAFELYEKSAMLGEEIAQSGIGKLYFFGRGCEKNLVKSYAYATMSGSTDEAALESIKFLFDGKLSDAELAEAKNLAGKLRAEAAKNKSGAGNKNVKK